MGSAALKWGVPRMVFVPSEGDERSRICGAGLILIRCLINRYIHCLSISYSTNGLRTMWM
jgi:hypothetical protein